MCIVLYWLGDGKDFSKKRKTFRQAPEYTHGVFKTLDLRNNAVLQVSSRDSQVHLNISPSILNSTRRGLDETLSARTLANLQELSLTQSQPQTCRNSVSTAAVRRTHSAPWPPMYLPLPWYLCC